VRDDLGCVDLFHLVFIEIRRGLVAVIPMLASRKLPERILCQILVILCWGRTIQRSKWVHQTPIGRTS